MPLSAESGFFWFFEPDNVEALVKVLDGRQVNGAHWLFATGLTDLDTRLSVFDSETGWSRLALSDRQRPLRLLDVGALPERRHGARILWVGAHPDDEILVAPWLDEICAPATVDCTLLVATRGENGVCQLPAGCGQDLGGLRALEMAASAQRLSAQLIQWQLTDVNGEPPEQIQQRWGLDETVRRLGEVLEDRAIDTVVTFDPRHGSTGHPAHRAIADIVAPALRRRPPAERPRAWAVATTVSLSGAAPSFGVRQSVAEPVDRLAADASFAHRWLALLDVAEIHASQFSPSVRDALARTPEEERFVALTPLR